MKRLALNSLKVAFSAGILAWVAAQASEPLAKLKGHPPNWPMPAVSASLCLAMVIVTFVRWYLLVRALELPFRLRDAMRLGFLGFMFNFVSLGSVGGDLFRAIFIAREQPGRRAEAVATVFIDRVIGLYALFVVASIAVLAGGLHNDPDWWVRLLCRLTLVGTAISTLGVFLMLTPGFTSGWMSQRLSRLPKVGHIARRLLESVRMYREKLSVLIVTVFMSLAVHACSTIGIYFAARGLPGEVPDLTAHFLIVPLAMLAAAMPVTVNGVGMFEKVLDTLFVQFGNGVVIAGTGSLVGLAYRVITIGIAVIGFGYYLANRAIVRQVMKQVSAEEELAGQEGGGDLKPASRVPRRTTTAAEPVGSPARP